MDPWAQYGMAGMMMSGFPALPPGTSPLRYLTYRSVNQRG